MFLFHVNETQEILECLTGTLNANICYVAYDQIRSTLTLIRQCDEICVCEITADRYK